MSRQQKINDWLDMTPIEHDFFGTEAAERRIVELECALAL